MTAFEELTNMIIDGQHMAASEWTQIAVDEGCDPIEVMDKGMIPGMDEIGRRWKDGEIHMPEVLIAARAMKGCMSILQPLITESNVIARGTVVIGTVKGDLHDIGKNIVAMMLEGAGYRVYDLGNDVPAEAFVNAAEEYDADIVGMSALLTTTVPMMESTIQALKDAEIRSEVKVMIGGAPVSDELAKQIGADGYAPDGAVAVDLTSNLISS
ncbi:MAG: corrinoid protein [Dehalococcoidia bacterium]|jgi:5-methyltetrahydrofolate--homocysteine methyltransferase|nr:cobalamin-binding protein [Chloroflexota bacterium]MDP6734295.1 corrinoid protein [Gammaproteobacteria bacterium]MDP7674446.1 corrinoid protein [Dehalococcoidia bacterium]